MRSILLVLMAFYSVSTFARYDFLDAFFRDLTSGPSAREKKEYFFERLLMRYPADWDAGPVNMNEAKDLFSQMSELTGICHDFHIGEIKDESSFVMNLDRFFKSYPYFLVTLKKSMCMNLMWFDKEQKETFKDLFLDFELATAVFLLERKRDLLDYFKKLDDFSQVKTIRTYGSEVSICSEENDIPDTRTIEERCASMGIGTGPLAENFREFKNLSDNIGNILTSPYSEFY